MNEDKKKVCISHPPILAMAPISLMIGVDKNNSLFTRRLDTAIAECTILENKKNK